jgi:hypothetical protein
MAIRDGRTPGDTSIRLEGEGGEPLRSALDAVVHVGDAALPLEDLGALQLDLLGSEALEQTAPLAEEHRDDMELELVEDAGGKRELRRSGAVDQRVPVARSLLGLSYRSRSRRCPAATASDRRGRGGEDEGRYTQLWVSPTGRRRSSATVSLSIEMSKLSASPSGDGCDE